MDSTDKATVESFGEEWTEFDQSGAGQAELLEAWRSYFSVLPAGTLHSNAVGVDIGCGTGRWAKFVAPVVGTLWCVDPSVRALEVAKGHLRESENVKFKEGAAGELPFAENSFDFAYSLGVLHHTPDTSAAMKDCVRVLKDGAPLLIYLYYAFDNRSRWYKSVWACSEVLRRWLSHRPFRVKLTVANAVGVCVYWPLARLAKLSERRFPAAVDRIPLATYRNRSLYMMRNDALDRFGTPLEQRFTKVQISDMMENAGLFGVTFSASEPYWCGVGYKQPTQNPGSDALR